MAARDDLDIPMPAMAPSYRVPPRRREEMDPATKRLAIFAGAIGGSLLLLVGVWSFSGHRSAGVPVIEPDSRPLRVKPANPGGLQVDGANDSILSGDGDAKQTVAPPPEAPAPQALQAQEQASAAATAAATAAAAAAASPAPPATPAATAQATAAQATPAQATPAPAAATVRPELQPLPALRPHITVPAAKPAQIAAAAPLAPAAQAPATAAPATVAQAKQLAPAKPALAAATPLPQPMVPAKQRTPAPAVAAPAQAAPAAAGGAQVQLASLLSEADANAEWLRLSHKYPDLLGGRRPVIGKTEVNGKTYWRLRTSGFPDATQAAVFCAQIKAKGAGCTVASF